MGERKHRYTTFSGCWTCKARKVKCDENPLGCGSCLRLGLTCGGYDIQLQWMSSDAGRRPNRNLSARVGRRRIGAGWTSILQFKADEIDEFLTRVNEEASRGVSTTHGPFTAFSVDRNRSNHRTSPVSPAEQALSGDSNGAVTAEGCPEGTPNCESNPHELNNQIPSLPSNSRLTPIDNLSLPSRTAGSQDDEHPEPGFQSHFAQDNQGLQTDSSEGVNDIAPCDTDILPNVEVSLLQQPQMFLSSSWKANELFHHYVTNVADILLPVTHPGNPYRSMYAPAALEGSLYFESGAFNAAPNIGLCIFHSLISTSAFHLHRCYNFKSEYYRLGIIHRQLALESLQMVLMKDVPLLNYKTILVALLSMVTIGVMEGSIIDFRVHLQGISNFQGPRRKWQVITAETRQLNTQSAFLNLLARTTSSFTPSPWLPNRELRQREQDSLTSNDNRSYCYEFTFGITADIAAAIQEITDLYECLQFYRQAQAPIPEGLLEACEDLGDRLLSWTLSADKVPSFNDRGTDELDIFKHHSHAWHGAALIFYLNCIQGAKPQDLVDEVATVASHMLAVEEIKSKHIANQMAPISWPAFIASCCALNREPWEAWWLDVQKYGIGSIRRQYTIVQEIWSEMDTNSSEGWLQILHRRDIQVLAA
ncbi:fungal-specific transcription factor domain-containing protein [Aspergillus flavus]|uniref:Fungal-specific transcription factor domain-containing protein n=2 Tax=Aspergillus subgen. Circumdati TaxID=2720871 RepID=A0A5N6GFF5_ASPFL|nr:fungal-specific transcription factor domain-containing protein [Aspergillus flavus]